MTNTPYTNEIRQAWVAWTKASKEPHRRDDAIKEFNTWLREHDTAVRADERAAGAYDTAQHLAKLLDAHADTLATMGAEQTKTDTYRAAARICRSATDE